MLAISGLPLGGAKAAMGRISNISPFSFAQQFEDQHLIVTHQRSS